MELNIINPNRWMIRDADNGGATMDGMISIRRGVLDLNLGEKGWAKVCIPIDESHYIKGMAIYRDDIPDGVDIVFNTRKKEEEVQFKELPFMEGTFEKNEYDRSPIYFCYDRVDWREYSKKIADAFFNREETEETRTVVARRPSIANKILNKILKRGNM